MVASSQSSTGDGGGTDYLLTAADGTPLCADECQLIPVDAKGVQLNAKVVAVKAANGPLVPVSAIGVDGGGKSFVVRDGKRTPVTIVVQDGGRAIVQGIADGDVISLYADDRAEKKS